MKMHSISSHLITLYKDQGITPKKIIISLIGYIAIGLGISLLVKANLGVGPYDVLTTGLAHFWDISLGNSVLIISVIFITLGWILKSKPGLMTFGGQITISLTITLFLAILPLPDLMGTRLVFSLVGFIAMVIGVAWVILANLGAAPPELVMLGLFYKGLPLRMVRYGLDGSFVLVGYLLGGQLGFVTLLFALAFSPALAFTLKLFGFNTTHNQLKERVLVTEI